MDNSCPQNNFVDINCNQTSNLNIFQESLNNDFTMKRNFNFENACMSKDIINDSLVKIDEHNSDLLDQNLQNCKTITKDSKCNLIGEHSTQKVNIIDNIVIRKPF